MILSTLWGVMVMIVVLVNNIIGKGSDYQDEENMIAFDANNIDDLA